MPQDPTRLTITLTDRGRVYAVLSSLDERWATLDPADRARAVALIELLADCYRRPLPRSA